ncbi:MAG: hypothetical protein H6822_06470 [Planctomycetaceae bacterium]|nr:hypothetical protein [Planctomycetales bacterium]MCB9921805.1 hypothetical protein [Planctomycetaceae bacterium]
MASNHTNERTASKKSTSWLVGEYWARRSGTTGHEIINGTGNVIAWTVDDATAALIVAGLKRLNDDRSDS